MRMTDHLSFAASLLRSVSSVNNTLSVALAGAEQEVRIRHTPNAVDKLKEAHKILGLTNQLYQQLDVIFNRMQLRKVYKQGTAGLREEARAG